MTWRLRGRWAATLLLGASSCVTWRVQWVAPERVLELESPSRMRVVMKDSTRVSLHEPRRVADSLVGISSTKHWSAPLDRVAYVLVPRGDAPKAVMYVLGTTLAALVALAVGMSGQCWGSC